MALVAWRGQSTLALLLGVAMMLVPPVAFSSGVPGDGVVLSATRMIWQFEGAAFRIFFPAFLLHGLASQSTNRAMRSRTLWSVVYVALGAVLFVVTSFGRDPLAWAHPGWERNTRFIVGLTLETLTAAVGGAMLFRTPSTQPVPLRLLYGSMVLAGATAGIYSFTNLWLGRWVGDDFVSGVNSLAMCLLPSCAALYFFGPGQPEARAWHGRRWTASAFSLALNVIHGLVIATAVAVVLNGSGQDLGGLEWLLFVTVIAATLLPAPALRWVRAMVDRRLFARWVNAEERAQAFGQELSGELDPHRIAQRVADVIPALLEVTTAELLFARGSPMRWGMENPSRAGASSLIITHDEELAAMVTAHGETTFPVHGPERSIIAAIRIGPRVDGGSIDPPARIIVTTICQGVSAALLAAKAHFDLRCAAIELADAERIAALGAMTGGLAHEIKNPLAGLKMGVYVLQRDGVDPTKLKRIERDVGRIDDLVSGLLRVSNNRDELDNTLHSLEEVDLRMVATACVADLRHSAEDRNIAMIEDYPDEPVLLLGTPRQFRLVILNLVSNAVENVSESGRVTVSMCLLPSTVEITVLDDGPGIPESIRARVFDLYFSTKSGGTGIGLALVRREAERLGGTVEVAFSSGQGTLFRVTLPRAA
ncbi:MAG: HAMP domain-containing sensor histidine kinase [bacterium]